MIQHLLYALAYGKGSILSREAGVNGFGCDHSILCFSNCTSAELDPKIKNSLSHRGQALNKFIKMLEQPPLSLYIHIPWCIKKCPYCDFNSHQVNGSFEEDNYTNKLYDDFLVRD